MKLFFRKKRIQKTPYLGFTLIELLVAAAVFVSGSTIAVSALFSSQAMYARIEGLRSILDGVNASFELMTRSIRYGAIIHCTNDIDEVLRSYRHSCPYVSGLSTEGGSVIVFRPADAVNVADRVGFYVENGKLYQFVYENGIVAIPLQMTSNDIYIDKLHFYIDGANTTQAAVDSGNTENSDATVDTKQPIVTVMISGRTNISRASVKNTPFELQSTVITRALDI